MNAINIDVSIIVVNWNTREVLKTCLRSVFANIDEASAEVIVVDNGSNDGSAEMVADAFPQVRLICNQDNRGFAAANNQGIHIARGKYVLLLNSDTEVLGDVISKSVDYLDQHSEVGVMGCRVLNGDGSPQLTCSRFPTLINLALLASGLSRFARPKFFGRYQIRTWERDSERDVDTVTGCYMLVRQTALEQVGTLDETFFFYGEETDWCKRFMNAGWKLRFAPVGEIIHYGSLSSRRCNHHRDLMLTRGLLRFHYKHGGRVPTAMAWCILGSFCALRSAYWSVNAALTNTEAASKRRTHFLRVLRDFNTVWPREVEVNV